MLQYAPTALEAGAELGGQDRQVLLECLLVRHVLQLGALAVEIANTWLRASLMAADQPETEALGQLSSSGGSLQALHGHFPAPDV